MLDFFQKTGKPQPLNQLVPSSVVLKVKEALSEADANEFLELFNAAAAVSLSEVAWQTKHVNAAMTFLFNLLREHELIEQGFKLTDTHSKRFLKVWQAGFRVHVCQPVYPRTLSHRTPFMLSPLRLTLRCTWPPMDFMPLQWWRSSN